MKFSLNHPSRGRPALAEAALREWRAKSSGDHSVEHVLSVDADDPELVAYGQIAARHGSVLSVAPNRSMVEATNRGAALATGEVIVSISDDFGCCEGWDRALAALVDPKDAVAVLVDDGLGARILTLPILTREMYRRIGFIYHPGYPSIFADDDLTQVVRRRGRLVEALHLRFEHRHPTAGLRPFDETDERQSGDRGYWAGWRRYQLRRIDDFGPPRTDPAARVARAGVELHYLVRRGVSGAGRALLRVLPRSARPAAERLRSATRAAFARLTGVP